MKAIPESAGKDTVDVIEDFDCSTQSEAYNLKFKEWRSRKENPFAFRFKANKRETVFNDSRGFETPSQASEEKRVISRLMFILGISMLFVVVTDNVISRAVAVLFGLFGVDIHVTLFSSTMYGQASSVVSVVVLVNMIRGLVPVLYSQKKLKLPMRTGYMSQVRSSVELINAIALTLIACTIVCLPTAYSGSTKEIYEFFSNSNTEVDLWGQKEFVFYAVFSILVFPALEVLFFNGPMFTALRQFGDPFAIIVTVTSACLLTRDFREMPATILITLIASVTMLRSGTIMTAIVVHIVYKMYNFALIMFEGSSSANMLLKRNMFMIAALIAGAVISGLIYIVRKKMKVSGHYIALYHSDTKPAMLLAAAAKSFPYTAVAILCIVEATVKIYM